MSSGEIFQVVNDGDVLRLCGPQEIILDRVGTVECTGKYI